jgi:hypothetical protein
LREDRGRPWPDYFDAEPVIAQKDVANARNQFCGFLPRRYFTGFILRPWFNFFRIEKETMAGLAEQPHVSSRIVVKNHADVKLALVILLDTLDGCNLSR